MKTLTYHNIMVMDDWEEFELKDRYTSQTHRCALIPAWPAKELKADEEPHFIVTCLDSRQQVEEHYRKMRPAEVGLGITAATWQLSPTKVVRMRNRDNDSVHTREDLLQMLVTGEWRLA